VSIRLLEFEKPIDELHQKIKQLKDLAKSDNIDLDEEIEKIEKRAEELKENIFRNLTPHQTVQIARHPNRPDTTSLARLIFDKFIPLHGDRLFRDDPSIVGGFGFIKKQRIMLIGHQKGHDTKENIYRNFGMPHPEGYRKALRLMKLADKFGLPIVTFIDTPGAYPGIEAEERGQAEAIARNLKEMASLKVPVITFVIGEGGSGGALAIGVANKLYMFEYSVYSVISPEGCASILFRDSKKSEVAASNLKMLAEDVRLLGIADKIISEPLGGIHNNWEDAATKIKKAIISDLKHYKQFTADDISEERYRKFRNIGAQFLG
jgi:acetyl-CoA carboxylase carboxyl transferase subunit alpha